MDGISAVAAVTELAGFSIKLVKALRSFLRHVEEAKDEIRLAKDELSSTHNDLAKFREQLEHEKRLKLIDVSFFVDLGKSTVSCEKVFRKIEVCLEKAAPGFKLPISEEEPISLSRWDKLRWPLQREEVEEITASLKQLRADFEQKRTLIIYTHVIHLRKSLETQAIQASRQSKIKRHKARQAKQILEELHRSKLKKLELELTLSSLRYSNESQWDLATTASVVQHQRSEEPIDKRSHDHIGSSGAKSYPRGILRYGGASVDPEQKPEVNITGMECDTRIQSSDGSSDENNTTSKRPVLARAFASGIEEPRSPESGHNLRGESANTRPRVGNYKAGTSKTVRVTSPDSDTSSRPDSVDERGDDPSETDSHGSRSVRDVDSPTTVNPLGSRPTWQRSPLNYPQVTVRRQATGATSRPALDAEVQERLTDHAAFLLRQENSDWTNLRLPLSKAEMWNISQDFSRKGKHVSNYFERLRLPQMQQILLIVEKLKLSLGEWQRTWSVDAVQIRPKRARGRAVRSIRIIVCGALSNPLPIVYDTGLSALQMMPNTPQRILGRSMPNETSHSNKTPANGINRSQAATLENIAGHDRSFSADDLTIKPSDSISNASPVSFSKRRHTPLESGAQSLRASRRAASSQSIYTTDDYRAMGNLAIHRGNKNSLVTGSSNYNPAMLTRMGTALARSPKVDADAPFIDDSRRRYSPLLLMTPRRWASRQHLEPRSAIPAYADSVPAIAASADNPSALAAVHLANTFQAALAYARLNLGASLPDADLGHEHIFVHRASDHSHVTQSDQAPTSRFPHSSVTIDETLHCDEWPAIYHPRSTSYEPRGRSGSARSRSPPRSPSRSTRATALRSSKPMMGTNDHVVAAEQSDDTGSSEDSEAIKRQHRRREHSLGRHSQSKASNGSRSQRVQQNALDIPKVEPTMARLLRKYTSYTRADFETDVELSEGGEHQTPHT